MRDKERIALFFPGGGEMFARLLTVFLLFFALPPAAAMCASFMNTGSMQSARQVHTATLLLDDRVLITGGYNGREYVATAELYDPLGYSFSSTGAMNAIRYDHTATLLPNGKVLIAGGRYSNISHWDTAELYDPGTGMFSYTTGPMSSPRSCHTATLLPSGKVLITGGYYYSDGVGNVPLSTAELYDPETGLFSSTGAMNYARAYHTATLLSDGKVLVAGGATSDVAAALYVDLFDPDTNTFSSANSLNAARKSHTATLLLNGNVLVTGGINPDNTYKNSSELYSSGAFNFIDTPMSSRRAKHTATLLADGKVLVAGGVNGEAVASADLYDPSNGTYGAIAATTSMNYARQGHTATRLTSGMVLVTGGERTYKEGETYYSITMRSTELYNPADITCILFSTDGVIGCHASIHDAYDAMPGDGVVKIQAYVLDSNLVLDRDIMATLKGGYTSDFDLNNLKTFIGGLTIRNGTAILENIVIKTLQ